MPHRFSLSQTTRKAPRPREQADEAPGLVLAAVWHARTIVQIILWYFRFNKKIVEISSKIEAASYTVSEIWVPSHTSCRGVRKTQTRAPQSIRTSEYDISFDLEGDQSGAANSAVRFDCGH